MLIPTSSLISLKLSSFNKIQHPHAIFLKKKEIRHLWKTFPKRYYKHDTGGECARFSERGVCREAGFQVEKGGRGLPLNVCLLK